MKDSPTEVQDNLTITWENLWNNVLQPDNSWKEDPKYSNMKQKLSYFNPTHTNNSAEHINKVIKCIIRGVRLTEEVINWHEPSIGVKHNKFDKLRGFQWRLVIAYSGFEITTKALMNHFGRAISPDIMNSFIDKCSLSTYVHLTPPKPRRKENLEKWLTKDEDAITTFLGVTAGDKKIIKDWIVKSNSISSWEDAVKLAKALRNASAHGFLLPKKVSDWQLKPGLNTLAHNLSEIMVAGLEKLI